MYELNNMLQERFKRFELMFSTNPMNENFIPSKDAIEKVKEFCRNFKPEKQPDVQPGKDKSIVIEFNYGPSFLCDSNGNIILLNVHYN